MVEEADRFRPDTASDEELIVAARSAGDGESDRYLEVLYGRYYRRVARWCVKVTGNPEQATDLAQEVFLRVHTKLDSFRLESSFSTWLYTVVRSVAINRGQAERRRQLKLVAEPNAPEPTDPAPVASATVERNETLRRVRRVMKSDLEPVEAKVLYLHYSSGLTLPAITRMLRLQNKSGAKAHVVSGMRKLRRHFGRADGRARAVEGS